MGALSYLLVALATYRLATDLAWETGPGEAYTRWRSRVIARYGAESWQAEGVSCPICISLWAAPVVLLLWLWLPWLVAWLAVAGAAALLVRCGS